MQDDMRKCYHSFRPEELATTERVKLSREHDNMNEIRGKVGALLFFRQDENENKKMIHKFMIKMRKS